MRNDPEVFVTANDPADEYVTSEDDIWIMPGSVSPCIMNSGEWCVASSRVIRDEEESEEAVTTGEFPYPPNDLPAFIRMRITAMEMALARAQSNRVTPATGELIDSAGMIYRFLIGNDSE